MEDSHLEVARGLLHCLEVVAKSGFREIPVEEANALLLKSQTLGTPPEDRTTVETAQILRRLPALQERIGAHEVGSSRDEYFACNRFYTMACRLRYRLVHALPRISASRQRDLRRLRASRYCLPGKDTKSCFKKLFQPIFEELDQNGAQIEAARLKRVLRKGYTVDTARTHINQLHLEDIPQECLERIRASLIESGLSATLEHYYGSKIGVCNVRAWRYEHDADGTEVVPHVDGLPPESLKLMAFRGLVTPAHGCFEALRRKSLLEKAVRYAGGSNVLAQVVGDDPLILVDANVVRHRARNPQRDHVRDTVELTILPRLEDDLLTVNGGCRAGTPTNPFASWSTRI